MTSGSRNGVAGPAGSAAAGAAGAGAGAGAGVGAAGVPGAGVDRGGVFLLAHEPIARATTSPMSNLKSLTRIFQTPFTQVRLYIKIGRPPA